MDDKKIGRLLIEKGFINEQQLSIALEEQKHRATKSKICNLMIEMGFIDADVCYQLLAQKLKVKSIDDFDKTNKQNFQFTEQQLLVLEKHLAFPLRFEETTNTISLAISDINQFFSIDFIRENFFNPSAKVDIFLCSQKTILNFLQQHFLKYQPVNSNQEDFLEMVFRTAIARKCSDIHFQPQEYFTRLCWRIDGELQEIALIHQKKWPTLLGKIKFLANLDISDNRKAQDGRFSADIFGKKMDFRVSVHPTLFGENIVIRILNFSDNIFQLEKLGFLPEHLKIISKITQQQQGLIIVTGATGSGKTTTLYSLLQQINSPKINIMTLEEPVEYIMPMIRQTSLTDNSKISFSDGIKSLLRQDPDVILVGEIRDTDTAIMAIRAAMTGHQVYATLHANSGLGVVARLMDLGISHELIAMNLIGVISQKLVKKSCGCIKEKRSICPICQGSRTLGRIVIAEVIALDKDIAFAISNKESLLKIETALLNQENHFSIEQDIRRKIEIGLLDEKITSV